MEIKNGNITFDAKVFRAKPAKEQSCDLKGAVKFCRNFLKGIDERLGSKSLEQREAEITNIENEWGSNNEAIQKILDASKDFPVDGHIGGRRSKIVDVCDKITKAIELAKQTIGEEENADFNTALNYTFGRKLNDQGIDRRLEGFDSDEFKTMNAKAQKDVISKARLVCGDFIKALELLSDLPDDQRCVALETLKGKWENNAQIINTIIGEASQVDEAQRSGVRNKLNQLKKDINLIGNLEKSCSNKGRADNSQRAYFDVIKAAIKTCFTAVGNVLTSAINWCKEHPVVTCLIATCIIGTIAGALYANIAMAAGMQIVSTANQTVETVPVPVQKVETCACNYPNAFAQKQCMRSCSL